MSICQSVLKLAGPTFSRCLLSRHSSHRFLASYYRYYTSSQKLYQPYSSSSIVLSTLSLKSIFTKKNTMSEHFHTLASDSSPFSASSSSSSSTSSSSSSSLAPLINEDKSESNRVSMKRKQDLEKSNSNHDDEIGQTSDEKEHSSSHEMKENSSINSKSASEDRVTGMNIDTEILEEDSDDSATEANNSTSTGASPSSSTGRKRVRFGNRYLEDESQVFQHNAWDNVEWDPEQKLKAENIVLEQAKTMLSPEQSNAYETYANEYWNRFYKKHENKFFKDRNWLFVEFPELMSHENNSSLRIFEVGCGVGNTVFPILQANPNPNLFIYAADFSATAVGIVQSNPLYTQENSRCFAFTHDITSLDAYPIEEGSLDAIVMIFVLSAVHPDKMQESLNRLSKLLKPGGCILLRDYGRHDLAQLRFKKGKMLSENFYVRGDGTRVYFFTQEDLDGLLVNAGLVKEFNRYDNRLIVNRAKQIKMYRVWLQCKYVKPLPTDSRLATTTITTTTTETATNTTSLSSSITTSTTSSTSTSS